MSKEKVNQLIGAIRYQFPPDGVRTCNVCTADDCGNTVIGYGLCAECLRQNLVELTSFQSAHNFYDAVVDQREAIENLYEDIK